MAVYDWEDVLVQSSEVTRILLLQSSLINYVLLSTALPGNAPETIIHAL
jgi:hypothetical protein